MQFSDSQENYLIKLAYHSISNYILAGRYNSDLPEKPDTALQKPYGAFVSIYVKGDLRGCIGTFEEDEPLYKNVQKMAIAAVSRDFRFQPINRNELEELELEISVLTPRKLIHDISEIKIGRHGIYIIKGFHRGTFLPQVAVEQKWTVEQFLEHCARYKAGLDWDDWKTADIYIYETYIIRSKKHYID